MNIGLWQLILGSTVLVSFFTGLTTLLVKRMEARKQEAEVGRLEAERVKIKAETDDLTSTRLIKELEALAARNTELGALVSRQSDLIDRLRDDVFKYAQREADHAIENATLRERIKILEASSPAPIEMKHALNLAFPVPENLTPPNEFDDIQE